MNLRKYFKILITTDYVIQFLFYVDQQGRQVTMAKDATEMLFQYVRCSESKNPSRTQMMELLSDTRMCNLVQEI